MVQFDHPDTFVRRHVGPAPADIPEMLAELGCATLEELADAVVPTDIRMAGALALPPPLTEVAALARLRELADRNVIARSYLGMGYYGTVTPPALRRNLLENPGWYTAYTPYQPEIAQGRLEALLNFQTMVCDLTAMEIANASLLDEATAAAEAMAMACNSARGDRATFVVAADCHPQTIAVVRTRAAPLGLRIVVAPPAAMEFDDDVFGVLLQYPATDGAVCDYAGVVAAAHKAGALAVVATDLLALCLLKPPGEWGADIVVGSSQRFGVPLGYGGPHAAFFATRDALKRRLPGRLVGVSRDAHGAPALRLALQTREQHIRRDRATSNICTAQVLLAVTAAMYAVYHGPRKLRAIAERVHCLTGTLAASLHAAGVPVAHNHYFDTLRVTAPGALERAAKRGINLRDLGDGDVGIALDETVGEAELAELLAVFGAKMTSPPGDELPAALRRESPFLKHPVFNAYHSETEFMRYLHRLETKDLALNTSMIPLGSCTMKLNAAAEMEPISWPGFADLHPFAPAEQAAGYHRLISDLEAWFCEMTGFAAISLQPNAGSQGELAGMLAIRAYHASRGEGERDACLIPASAHGTNPASAVMAGMRVVPVACDADGNIDLADLRAKAAECGKALAALMVTYPSTHGVFETHIREVCDVVHAAGGQVYLDGANLNAMVGLCRPAEFGADVCHLNLHKTFCIPHGGGGPGMGPIGVAAHLAPFLPGDPLVGDGAGGAGAVSAANFGSPLILPITWAYIAMMGAAGLREATQVAILNANYVAQRLGDAYPVLYTGATGRVAHECILDTRQILADAGLTVDDVAKRLIDYGYHAPTMSFPVPGTLMVEPTESESRAELDRFCDAMLAIRAEIAAVADGSLAAAASPLSHAPHTVAAATANEWDRAYPRAQGAFPAAWLRDHKYWPPVGRVDQPWGDRNLVCSCPDDWAEQV
ncbi:MAG TPA: aminomethyl-transferring glycine dehydrogenase [Marine Group III euryarchaeote]|uniref:glycine dehydrogenase (aminomethyl-transferring) n=1 Tax=Marine Group III euryarchaeote TaxID=2173149 RepID=A0A7C7ZDY6_9ARCH|nr:aminomethyl-transferring glycine dehydrogenase [Marine Group III euryarchaeote]